MTTSSHRVKVGVLLVLVAGLTAYYHSQDTWNTADPTAVLKEARSLAQSGQHAKALRRYQWVHRWLLRDDVVWMDVATPLLHDYAIAYWADLAKEYPRARESLFALREQNEARLQKGEDSSDLFREVIAVNQEFSEESRTVKLFRELHKAQPRLASKYFHIAWNHLVRGREYQLCATYIADPAAELRNFLEFRKTELEMSRVKENVPYREQMELDAEQNFLVKVGELLEILAGAGRTEEAERVRQRALAVKDTLEAREAMDAAIRRATSPR